MSIKPILIKDITHIILTHAHPDHIRSFNERRKSFSKSSNFN
ncbi:TPA: MBL fold metallo-hydrolase [Campylobacter jejuni]|nr:MBL fold metallo-hydrolase [Campylobacter jejuni]